MQNNNNFQLNREIDSNQLISHIQTYFSNKFMNHNEIIIMINTLIELQYFKIKKGNNIK